MYVGLTDYNGFAAHCENTRMYFICILNLLAGMRFSGAVRGHERLTGDTKAIIRMVIVYPLHLLLIFGQLRQSQSVIVCV